MPSGNHSSAPSLGRCPLVGDTHARDASRRGLADSPQRFGQRTRRPRSSLEFLPHVGSVGPRMDSLVGHWRAYPSLRGGCSAGSRPLFDGRASGRIGSHDRSRLGVVDRSLLHLGSTDNPGRDAHVFPWRGRSPRDRVGLCLGVSAGTSSGRMWFFQNTKIQTGKTA